MSMGIDWLALLPKLLAVVLVLALVLTIPMFVGTYVYYDAKRRKMNAVLWTLTAVVAPALVGFIIYLLVRGGHPDLECPRCGAQVTERYTACPQCGAKLRLACPGCAAPAEPDWKVCPYCAAPLDGAGEGVTPPVRRKDKGLGRVLAVVVVVPVLLVVIAVAGYVAQPKTGSATMQEVTFDEYIQFQKEHSETVLSAVYDWMETLDVRTDRAYALRYDLPGEYDYENKYYYLIGVPSGGQRGHNNVTTSFGLASGLFAPTIEIELEDTGDSGSVFCVVATSEKPPTLNITLDGKHIRCEVQEVDYNPTTFLIYPDYSQMERDEVRFLPERISVVKMRRTGKGSSSVEDTVEVTDGDTLFQLMAAIDGGERLDWGHPIYSDCDISGGFEVIIEYQVHEEYIFHDDMARLHVFQQDGACYLVDHRIKHGDNFRLMNEDFYELLEGLF